MSGIPGAFGGGIPAGPEEQQLVDQVGLYPSRAAKYYC